MRQSMEICCFCFNLFKGYGQIFGDIHLPNCFVKLRELYLCAAIKEAYLGASTVKLPWTKTVVKFMLDQ